MIFPSRFPAVALNLSPRDSDIKKYDVSVLPI